MCVRARHLADSALSWLSGCSSLTLVWWLGGVWDLWSWGFGVFLDPQKYPKQRTIDPILLILSMMGYWAIVFGTLEV